MSQALSLGLDAGGTGTRWALADADGEIRAEGQAGGLTALQLGQPDGQALARATVQGLAADLAATGLPAPERITLGITGYTDDDAPARAALQALFAAPWALAPQAVAVHTDVALAYHAAFAPGAGFLLYAGTGSIGVHIDAEGRFHRVGGRGHLIGDGGSGHWIAIEALRRVWQREDESPGAWRDSPLARALFARIGGSDWAASRRFVYQGERGAVGQLALAVAEVADADPQAAELLQGAGAELAALAATLRRRFGARPVCLAGRVAELHPRVLAGLRAALPPDTMMRSEQLQAHHAAARLTPFPARAPGPSHPTGAERAVPPPAPAGAQHQETSR